MIDLVELHEAVIALAVMSVAIVTVTVTGLPRRHDEITMTTEEATVPPQGVVQSMTMHHLVVAIMIRIVLLVITLLTHMLMDVAHMSDGLHLPTSRLVVKGILGKDILASTSAEAIRTAKVRGPTTEALGLITEVFRDESGSRKRGG
jgi:small-conductance mechanosensitive channel